MKNKLPQRKPNKVLSPEELMNKAFYGTPKVQTQNEKRKDEWEGLNSK